MKEIAMKIRFHLFLLAAMCLTLSACDFGEVDQGRCIAYNENTGKFTMILDVNHDQFNPQYTGGAYEYQMPADPKECGPAPKAGGRVHFDIEKKQIVIYNNGKLEELAIEFTDIQSDILSDNPKVKGHKFPVINKDAGTITEYSKRLKKLITFKVPAEYLSLPDSTWEAGDDCRIYYKPNAKHQALRFMNVTQTNIFKK